MNTTDFQLLKHSSYKNISIQLAVFMNKISGYFIWREESIICTCSYSFKYSNKIHIWFNFCFQKYNRKDYPLGVRPNYSQLRSKAKKSYSNNSHSSNEILASFRIYFTGFSYRGKPKTTNSQIHKLNKLDVTQWLQLSHLNSLVYELELHLEFVL